MELTYYADYCWDGRGRGFRQRELTVRQVYDAAYLAVRYEKIDDKVRALSARRLAVLAAFVPRGPLLDFGCGTGRFTEEARSRGWHAVGCDVVADYGAIPTAHAGTDWPCITFFDSLEHLPEPDETIRNLNPKWVMVSVPECHFPDSPAWFMAWKHRRPGEHLWHWDRESLDKFFLLLGFEPIMHSYFEDDFRSRDRNGLPNILSAIYRKM